MITSLFKDKLLKSGARPVSTTMTLGVVPEENIQIDGDLAQVDFNFTKEQPFIAYSAELVCIVYIELKNKDSLRKDITLYIPVVGGSVTFGLPEGSYDAVERMYVGYSNGLFGGCSRTYYLESRRMFNYYDTCLFDTQNKVYYGHGNLDRNVLIQYKEGATNLLYIGFPQAKLGESYLIGGII